MINFIKNLFKKKIVTEDITFYIQLDKKSSDIIYSSVEEPTSGGYIKIAHCIDVENKHEFINDMINKKIDWKDIPAWRKIEYREKRMAVEYNQLEGCLK